MFLTSLNSWICCWSKLANTLDPDLWGFLPLALDWKETKIKQDQSFAIYMGYHLLLVKLWSFLCFCWRIEKCTGSLMWNWKDNLKSKYIEKAYHFYDRMKKQTLDKEFVTEANISPSIFEQVVSVGNGCDRSRAEPCETTWPPTCLSSSHLQVFKSRATEGSNIFV